MSNYKRHKIDKTKICKTCYEEFTPEGQENYCCDKCKIIGHSYPKKQVERRICKYCSVDFQPLQINQTFCSSKCCRSYSKKKYLEEKEISYFEIFRRDNFRCVYCGKSSIEDGVKLVLEHIYPRNKGGDNQETNLITSCEKCNLHKQDKILDKDIIFRLWKHNKEKPIPSYDSLKIIFDKIYSVKP